MLTFGEEIRLFREKNNISQVKMSKKYGIPLSTITSFEQGLREPPEWQQNMILYALNNGYEIDSKDE